MQTHKMFSTYVVGFWAVTFFLLSFIGVTSADPFAVTSVGLLQGTQHVSPHGLPYYAFRGIPYAKPPTGDLRWKLPHPFPAFDSVYEAVSFKPGCPQNTKSVNTSEDCLYLDVYVPGNVTELYDNATEALEAWANGDGRNSGTGDNSRAVMIWIHGGAYHSGYGQGYTGWKVATEQNIVVVVIQYRLGALGFLSTGDDFLPGNYGLWDQQLAMKWVKDNIRGFGGDVSMVTIVGESAGASSVSQHTVSRHSSGLFQRAVMMSGTVEAAWCFRRNPRAAFDRLSEVAGCGGNSTSQEARLHCLQQTSADDIHRAAVVTEGGDFVTFVPVIDGDFFPDDVHTLLNDDDYLSSVGFYDYDVLVGVLNNEGVITFGTLAALSPTVVQTGRVPHEDIDGFLLDGLLLQELGESYGPDTKDAVNNRYFYPRYPEESSVPVQKFFDLYTDASFAVPAVKYLRDHARREGTSRAGVSTSPSEPPPPSQSVSSSRPPTQSSSPSSSSSSSLSSSNLTPSPSSAAPSPPSPTPPSTSQPPAPALTQSSSPLSSSSSSLSSSHSTPSPSSAAPSQPPSPTPPSTSQPPAPAPRPSRAYFYYFDWVPSLTKGTVFSGMPHGLDVDYLFGLTKASMTLYGAIPLGGSISREEHDLSRMYGDMIGAFVRTGNPNNGLPPSFSSKNEWLPYDATEETFLRFSPSPSIDNHLHPSTASLWIDLVPRLHSRWLQQTANERPTAARSQSEKFTDFKVTENEANTMLISLVIVSVVLLLFNVFLLVIFIRLCRRKVVNKYEMTNMDRTRHKEP